MALGGQFGGQNGVQVALGGQFEGQVGVQVALGGQLEGPSGVQEALKLQMDFLGFGPIRKSGHHKRRYD